MISDRDDMRNPDQPEVMCPSCGEPTEIHYGVVGGAEDFIEDCSVCCRPMLVHVTWGDDGELSVWVEAESD